MVYSISWKFRLGTTPIIRSDPFLEGFACFLMESSSTSLSEPKNDRNKISLHENVVFSVCALMDNAAYVIYIMRNFISGIRPVIISG